MCISGAGWKSCAFLMLGVNHVYFSCWMEDLCIFNDGLKSRAFTMLDRSPLYFWCWVKVLYICGVG